MKQEYLHYCKWSGSRGSTKQNKYDIICAIITKHREVINVKLQLQASPERSFIKAVNSYRSEIKSFM
jgi:hypothetical protein